MDFLTDPRFKGIEKLQNKVWLSSPTMHGDEQRWVDEAIQTNWVSTVGQNINVVEQQVAEKIGRKYAVALSSGTAALHLAIRLCGEKLYGPQPANKGVLEGHKVMTVYDSELCRRNNRTGRLGTCYPSPKWRFPINAEHQFQIVGLVAAFSFVITRLNEGNPLSPRNDAVDLFQKLFFLRPHLRQLIGEGGQTHLFVHT